MLPIGIDGRMESLLEAQKQQVGLSFLRLAQGWFSYFSRHSASLLRVRWAYLVIATQAGVSRPCQFKQTHTILFKSSFFRIHFFISTPPFDGSCNPRIQLRIRPIPFGKTLFFSFNSRGESFFSLSFLHNLFCYRVQSRESKLCCTSPSSPAFYLIGMMGEPNRAPIRLDGASLAGIKAQ